jgi:hypothetical protein
VTLANTPSLRVPPPTAPLGREGWRPRRSAKEEGNAREAVRCSQFCLGNGLLLSSKVGMSPLVFPCSFGSATAVGRGGDPGGG